MKNKDVALPERKLLLQKKSDSLMLKETEVVNKHVHKLSYESIKTSPSMMLCSWTRPVAETFFLCITYVLDTKLWLSPLRIQRLF